MDSVTPVCRRQLPSFVWRLIVCVSVAVGGISLSGIGTAQDQISAQQEDAIAAYVDQRPVYASDIEYEVAKALGHREASEQIMFQLRSKAREQLVSQKLIQIYLEREDFAASDADVELELERLTDRLQRTETELETYLQENGLTLRQFRDRTRWQIGWQRFLGASLTEQNLAAFFESRQAEFDGTERLVWQIFVAPQQPRELEQWEEAEELTRQIKSQLKSEDSSFAELAREFSQAPTAEEGGRIGWAARNGQLDDEILRVVFALKPGEVSDPIRTVHGMHLVRWTEEKPGELGWEEALPRLRPAATRYLFEWVADQVRDEASIELSDSYPPHQESNR